MEIRHAVNTDVNAIIQLIIDRINWMDEVGLKEWNQNNYLDFYTKDYFEENIDSFYVVEDQNNIVGAICFYIEDENWDDDKECYYVHHLVTDVHYKGLGKLLLLYGDILSLKKGYDVIRLDSSTYDQKLTSLYESIGYKPVKNFVQGRYQGTTREKKLTCPYDAIIFDIDGTLLNTFDMNFYPLLQIIKEEKGLELSIEDVKKYASYPGLRTIAELEIEDIETTYARWVKYVNEYPGGASMYPYIDLILKSIHLPLGVVSSKKQAQYKIDFVSKGLDQNIKASVLEEDTSKHKPDPTPILTCCEKLGVDVSKVLYIGDTYSDYQTCVNAGCNFGYALYGNINHEEIKDATYIFESPIDILTIFTK